MQLLEEEYKIQQNMLINFASKYETYNHLLNLIVIREDNRNNIKNENDNNINLNEGKNSNI